MGCKSVKRAQKALSAEDEFPKSSRFLMNRCFLVILMNMLFGLLPVTISGDKVRHAWCSLSTVFSIASGLSLFILSYVFAPLVIIKFLSTPGSSATDVLAIGILKASHIAGFLLLILNSHFVARKLPRIWKDLVRCFHIAVIEVYGDRWPPLSKFTRFTCQTLFLYLLVILVTMGLQGGSVLSYIIPLFYERFAPRHPGVLAPMVAGGFIIWDMAALSHILVSIVLTLFVLVVVLCLKSVNMQLEELIETESSRCELNASSSLLYNENEKVMWAKLDRFKRVYGLCEDITGALSKSWGVPLIVESIVLIGNTLVNTFFIVSDVMVLIGGDSGITRYSGYNDFLTLILSSIIHFYFLFQLSSVVTKMIRESKKPLRILKNMSDHNVSVYTRNKIASFKTDIAEAEITLTAANYFQVNKFLITSLVGSLTTYLIVLMQFKQQDTNEHEQGNSNCTALD